jgi:predicted nucleotidyltransferase
MDARSDPTTVLFGRTRQAILSLMFMRPDESFYLREILRRTGRGTGAVQRELAQLTQCGILRKDRERFYQANPKSPVFEPLKQLVIRSAGLIDGLRDALAAVADRIAVAFIFGSFARGEQHEASDVDLMIITREGNVTINQIVPLLRNQQAALGREINPFILSARELHEKMLADNHFIRRVLAGSKTFLIGGDDELGRLAEERLAQAPQNQPRRNRRPARVGRA